MEGYKTVMGRKIHYVQEGNKGRQVVLLHGLGGSAEQWEDVIPLLSENFRVYAFELPGFGRSDTVKRYQLAIPFASQFMNEARKAFNIQDPIVVGSSLGGLFALQYALDYQKQQGYIDKLVLVDSAGLGREINWVWRVASLPLVGEIIRILNPSEWPPDSWMWRLSSAPYIGDSLKKIRERIEEQQDIEERITKGNKQNALRLLRYGVNIFGQRYTIRRGKELREIEVPTLIVWGKNDNMIPMEHAVRAHRRIRDSDIHIFKNAGHTPHVDCPQEFANLLTNFINK